MRARGRRHVRLITSLAASAGLLLTLTGCSVPLPIWVQLSANNDLKLAYCDDVTVDHYRLELRNHEDEVVLSASTADGPVQIIKRGQVVDIENVAPGWTYSAPSIFRVNGNPSG